MFVSPGDAIGMSDIVDGHAGEMVVISSVCCIGNRLRRCTSINLVLTISAQLSAGDFNREHDEKPALDTCTKPSTASIAIAATHLRDAWPRAS